MAPQKLPDVTHKEVLAKGSRGGKVNTFLKKEKKVGLWEWGGGGQPGSSLSFPPCQSQRH